jgi:AcrR family transcriptional regulator
MTGIDRATLTSSRLSREVILDAYIRLADEEGPEAISLRRLGAELGVDATAVYRHFRDKDALLEAVADRLLQDLADRYRPTGGWRDDLRRLAIEGRAMYLGHPRLARIIAASPEPLPGNRRLTEQAIGSLRAAGLSDRDAALAYEALASYVAGASSLDAEIGPDAGDAWRGAFAALDADRFPNVTAVARHLYRSEPDAFEFGLDLFLEAIATRARLDDPPALAATDD